MLHLFFSLYSFIRLIADPAKQFLMLIEHIDRIRFNIMWSKSPIMVLVEHNLGFEAEHHERALRHLPNVTFYKDPRRQRVGILTTLQVKHAMCTLTKAMLIEKRISVLKEQEGFVSRDGAAMKRLLMEELETYSYQFKSASSIFSRDQCALSGKVGGMRDDLAIVFQLAVYWTNILTDTVQ
jgi:hypothetical protein